MPSANRILLAEDNEVNARLVVAVLGQVGYAVTVAVNGEQAAEMAATGEFDLVLMDVNMPEINGLEATKRIRAGAAPACDMTIIALTADDDSVMRRQCADAGMDGYISKPIDMADLKSTVELYLGKERRIA